MRLACFAPRQLIFAAAALVFMAAPPLRAQGERLLHGKVVMQDGSPLPKPVPIERTCGGRVPVRVGGTNKEGEIFLRVSRRGNGRRVLLARRPGRL